MAERDDGCVRWFGESWGAPINVDCERTPTPVGTLCLQCDAPIEATDRGVTMIGVGFEDREGYVLPGSRVAVHIDCHVHSVLGVHVRVWRKPPLVDTAQIKADGLQMFSDLGRQLDGDELAARARGEDDDNG